MSNLKTLCCLIEFTSTCCNFSRKKGDPGKGPFTHDELKGHPQVPSSYSYHYRSQSISATCLKHDLGLLHVYKNLTKPLLPCLLNKTAVSRDQGFTSFYIYVQCKNVTQSAVIMYDHINCESQMSHADVTAAPPIEGQIQEILSEFVFAHCAKKPNSIKLYEQFILVTFS